MTSSNKFKYEKLIAYASGELSGDEAESVSAFLKTNPAAAQTVAMYKQAHLMASTDESIAPPMQLVAKAKSIFSSQVQSPAISWIDQLQQIIVELVFDSRAQPALAGIRGVGTAFQASYETEQVSVDIEAEPIEESASEYSSKEQWRIMGQIDMPESAANVDVAMIPSASTTALESKQTTTDEHGMFTVEVETGTYDLLIRCGDSVVVLKNINIA